MTIDDVKGMISDLLDVAQVSIGTDKDAAEAAQWIDLEKKTEAQADEVLEPAIKEAFAKHRELTGAKKKLLEKLLAAKDRVRVNLANWIAGGHDVEGCHIVTKFRVTVVDVEQVPEDYVVRAVDEKKLAEWVKQTEGKIPVPGVSIEPINVLHARES